MVVTQHTAQTLAAFDWAGRAANLLTRHEDRVVEPLVVPFFEEGLGTRTISGVD
jgi:hypothetical protein